MVERILKALKIQEPIEELQDKDEINRQYKYWRIRIMYSMMIGYATFYFVRKNFSMANPAISEAFNFTNTEMGLILSTATIVYAFSKFASGVLADQANPRYFMAIGLILSALMNLFFGFSNALIFFVLFWALNNLFQGMGMPPCSRLLSVWYSPKESGRAWGIWNASHQLGGASIIIISGFLVAKFGWRSAFILPALWALLISIFLMNRLRDTPESLGLPPVEVFTGDKAPRKPSDTPEVKESQKEIFVKYILKNKMIWVVAAANFFVYIVRIGIIDWAPKMLVDAKGLSLKQAGFAVSTFEIAGMTGAFISGLLSDKIFGGRRGPVTVIFMLFLIGSVFSFMAIPKGSFYLLAGNLMLIGFFVYGPQMLVAVAAADFATKKAAATAVGLTGLFGYIGASVCGIGTGMIVDAYGWNGGLYFYMASAFIGTILFLTIWNKKAPSLE